MEALILREDGGLQSGHAEVHLAVPFCAGEHIGSGRDIIARLEDLEARMSRLEVRLQQVSARERDHHAQEVSEISKLKSELHTFGTRGQDE